MSASDSEPKTFLCPNCGMTSHNPRDFDEGYCGNCHDYTAAPGTAARASIKPHRVNVRRRR